MNSISAPFIARPIATSLLAIAVLLEDGAGKGQSGSGNGTAGPIAKKVIEAVLNR